jgi:protein-S-isoprenylcysteine O-methyltransferase Ste14
MNSISFEILLRLHMVLKVFWLAWRFSTDGPAWLRWSPHVLIVLSWAVFALYWLVTALGSKRPARTESSGGRIGHIAFMVVAFYLLCDSAPPFLDWLNRRFVPDEGSIDWLGAWLTFGGVLFAIWARATIGKDWSAEVQIKEGHELIRSGPYAYIRHPIYTGILLAVAGSAVSIGEYRALLACAVMCVGFARKAKKEESFLAAEFGPAFQEHRRRTGFFLPRLS